MNTNEESVDRLLSYLHGHGVDFTFEQFEAVSRLLCRCQGRDFQPEAMAGFLAILRYALRLKESTSRPNNLDYHASTIEAMHNVKTDLASGIGKLYEVFAACQHNEDLTGIPVAIEFKHQLERLSEFFTKVSSDNRKDETL